MDYLPESLSPSSDAPILEETPEIDLRDRLTWSNLGLVLSIPALAALTGFGLICLYDPTAIGWLAPSESPAFYTNSFWNLPKSQKQIQAELAKVQLQLGETYDLNAGEILYTVLEKETKNIREIRLYQKIGDRGEEKLLLVSTTTIAGIDEYFVRSPLLKYVTYEVPERLQPNRNRLPLKKFSLLANTPKEYGGLWFTTAATVDGITYGQIYHFVSGKRSQLYEMEAWTSPAAELPQWRNVLTTSKNKFQLVVNQTQFVEPAFLLWQLEPNNTQPNNTQPLPAISQAIAPAPWQLRQVTLNEGKNQPVQLAIYREALVLASAGLWSPALVKFNTLLTDLRSQGKEISPFLQEQHDLIALHAQATVAQTKQSISNLGKKALVNIVDGRWDVALAIASDPAYKDEQVAEMLAKYHPHIWQRVDAMLTFAGVPQEVKLWGGLVILQKQGLRRAETWLRSQKVAAKEYDPLLQRLDLAPLALNPQQLLGTVSHLGKNLGNASKDWFLTVPPLETNQAWYEVSIHLLKTNQQWRNAPFPELSDRSSQLLWRVLGLALNNNLGIILYDAYGKVQTATITAQSLWVSDDGDLKILASGQDGLANLLKSSIIPPLITSGGAFQPPNGKPVPWNRLSNPVIERIIRNAYRQLQGNGQVSVSIEEFSLLVQGQWQILEVNLDGAGKPEYLLLLEREQVDLGDRYYPMAIAFASDGALLFSDMNGGRLWIDVLPSSIEGQILTLRNGRYEVWNFR
jgi:hypothetical protein